MKATNRNFTVLAGLSVLSVAALLSGTGCASIVNGANQDIPISTEPAGARILVDGKIAGESPCVLKVRRGDDHTIVVEAEGHTDQTRHLARKMSRAFWGNIWLGGLPGMLVDLATGSCYDLVPSDLHIELAAVRMPDETKYAESTSPPPGKVSISAAGK